MRRFARFVFVTALVVSAVAYDKSARGDDVITNLMSPIASYQFENDLNTESLTNGGAVSPIASYHYLDDQVIESLTTGGLSSLPASYRYPSDFGVEALTSGGLSSEVASYLYFDSLGTGNAPVTTSPTVSYFYDGGILQAFVMVAGKVMDASSGLPVAGAAVQLGGATATSDSLGSFVFTSVEAGEYLVTATKFGYADASQSVFVSPASAPSVVLSLQKASVMGSAPRITSVTSKYSGFRYFLDGVTLNVKLTASVDWAGHSPGSVQFIAPRKTYTVSATGNSVQQSLNMGSDFGPNGRLRVVATAADGAKSGSKTADLVVIPNPLGGLLGVTWSVDDSGNGLVYSQTTSSPESFIDNLGIDPGQIPSDIPLFGGKSMSFGFLPEVSYQVNSSDGTMDISMAWSDADAGKLLDADWESGDITGLTDHMNRLLDSGTLSKLEVPKAGFGGLNLSFYPVIGGGWRYDLVSGQWGWKDADVGVAGDFSIQQTWPFLAGPLPMYAKINFDLNAQATAQLLNTTPVSLNGNFTLEPTLRGSLGVGLNEVASVEGWVEGGLTFNLQYPMTPTIKDASVDVKAGATVYFLLFTKDWVLGDKEWDLYSSKIRQPLLMSTNAGPTVLGRGYLSYATTGTMGRTVVKPKVFGSPRTDNPEILMSPAMPFAEADCCSAGTNFYLVFLEDNTNRTSMNRTMAMFSKFDGTMWSAPITLGDDGTADFHPNILTFADGTAIAAWENEGGLQPDTAGLSDMVSNLEVSVAWYDPTTAIWSAARQMTTNNFVDRSPKLAGVTKDNVLLTWLSNTGNDTDGSATAPNQIFSSKWDGNGWSVPQLVCTVSNALLKYDVVYDGTNGNLVMSVDTVSGSTNADGHELFRAAYQNGAWGALTQLTTDSVPDDNPRMVLDGVGNVILAWLKGNELSSAVNFDLANRKVARTNEYSSNLADFSMARSSDGKMALIWAEPSENNSDLYSEFFDPIFQAWGSPKQMTHDPQAEYDRTVALYGTNELIVVYNRTMVSSTNSADTSLADLAACYYPLTRDLALDSKSYYCVPRNPAAETIATLHVRVLNQGDSVETNVAVAFYQNAAARGNEIGRMVLTNALIPQASNDVAFTFYMPDSGMSSIVAVVDPGQSVPDLARSNNTVEVELDRPGLKIESMSGSVVASNLVAVTVHVVNDGAGTNGDVSLALNDGTGNLGNVFNQDIGTIEPGASADFTFFLTVSGDSQNMNVDASLVGPGMANNIGVSGTSSILSVAVVPPPWIGECEYLADGHFQMAVYGATGLSYVLQASTDLMQWISVASFTCADSPEVVVDSSSPSFKQRFYRIAPISVVPSPLLAIDSTQQLRLQGLSGFGYGIEVSPDLVTWSRITNFTMTNAVLYFRDVSNTNYGQRFYRAVAP